MNSECIALVCLLFKALYNIKQLTNVGSGSSFSTIKQRSNKRNTKKRQIGTKKTIFESGPM